MNRNRTFGEAGLLLITVLVCSGIAYAITNGQPDGNQHPYVAFVSRPFPGVPAQGCSGVAVSPGVVVTAAHCAMYWAEPVTITFDPQWKSATAKWHTGKIYPHPNYAVRSKPGYGASTYDTHDVAVIVLDTLVTLPAYPILPTVGLVDTLPMKTQLTVVGYGIHGWTRDQGNPFDDPDVDFTRYNALTELVASNDPQSNEYLKLTANKGGNCYGDSGGPALLGNIVLGITSYVNTGNCTGVTYSNRLDLTYALDFIQNAINGVLP